MNSYDSSSTTQLHYLLIQDKRGRRIIDLRETNYSIGRAPTNSIVLHSPGVSRHHAILFRFPQEEMGSYCFRIFDGDLHGKKSTNGLKINGKVKFACDLQSGDIICFGEDAVTKYFAIPVHMKESIDDIFQAIDLSELSSQPSDPFETIAAPEQVD